MFNKKLLTSMLVLSSLALVGCWSAPTPSPDTWSAWNQVDKKMVDEAPKEEAPKAWSITDIVVATEWVSILKDIVVSLELTDMLSNWWPYTVFAPTNEAFTKLLGQLDMTYEELTADKDILKTIVQYHVLEGKVYAEDVLKMADGSSVKAVNGQSFIVSNKNGVMVNDSKVISTDIEASNWVVHLIDTVLVPASVSKMLDPETKKTIAVRAMDSGNFPTLIAAVQAAWLVDMLNDEWPYTVFAPTEQAFAALLSEMDMTAEDLLADTDLLKKVLAYHVLPGVYSAEDVMALKDATGFETAEWSELTIDPNNGQPMINNSKLIDTDMFTTNGVIHVIDSVLMPNE